MSSEVREFTLTQEYIELNKLLKFESFISSGAEAGVVISDGLVQVNGEVESRKRRKLRSGDEVMFENVVVKVV